MFTLHFCCVFFFFKQKTAYEIGTGDWSSDVCLPISGVFVLPARQLSGWLDRITPHNAQGEYYLTDVIGQIGRASCRERV